MKLSLADTATLASRGKATARSSRQHDTTARGGNSTDSQAPGTTGVLNVTSCTSTAGQRPKTALDEKVLAALQERAVLQERGYVLAGAQRRVKRCGCDPRRRDRAVAVGVGEHGGTQVAGMQRCGTRWCPRCWGLVTKDRAHDVQAVTKWASDQGFQIALVTLTAAHVTAETKAAAKAAGKTESDAVRMQALKPLLTAMQGAWAGMIAGRRGKALRQGWIGYARAVELTADDLTIPAGQATETGYHVHWHTVLILDASVDLDDLGEQMFDRWESMCERRGLRAEQQGFDMRKADSPAAAAAYVTKGEQTKKSLGHELASSGTKTAGHRRVTPEQVLRNLGRAVAQTTGTKRRRPQDFVSADLREPATYPPATLSRLRAQWMEIESAFSGARWLTWSRDLRKLAGLDAEETAEEVANRSVAPKSSRVAVMDGRYVARHGRWDGVDQEAEAAAWDDVRLERTADPARWVQNLDFWQVKRQMDRHLHSLPEALDPEARFDSLTAWLTAQGITAFRVLAWEEWQEETADALRAEGAEHHARTRAARAEDEAAERLAERLAAAEVVPAAAPALFAAPPAGHSAFGPLPWLSEEAAE